MPTSARKIALSLATAGRGILVSLAALAVGLPAQAVGTDLTGDVVGQLESAGKNTGLSTGGGGGLPAMIGQIIQAVLGVVGVVIVAFFIYAGYLWLTAQGNEEQVTKAKDIIKNAVIGAVLVFAAYAISTFIVSALLKGTMITPTP